MDVRPDTQDLRFRGFGCNPEPRMRPMDPGNPPLGHGKPNPEPGTQGPKLWHGIGAAGIGICFRHLGLGKWDPQFAIWK